MIEVDKIIFLDVDGVLNSNQWAEWCYHHIDFIKNGGSNMFDPKCVERIINVCESTGAYVVMSSSWRMWSLEQTLKNLASKRDLRPILEKLVGITPRTEKRHRGTEIKYFLDCCKKQNFYTDSGEQLSDGRFKFSINPKYIIIDDDEDMLEEQLPHFLHTDFMVGFTDKDMEKTIKILNESN